MTINQDKEDLDRAIGYLTDIVEMNKDYYSSDQQDQLCMYIERFLNEIKENDSRKSENREGI